LVKLRLIFLLLAMTAVFSVSALFATPDENVGLKYFWAVVFSAAFMGTLTVGLIMRRTNPGRSPQKGMASYSGFDIKQSESGWEIRGTRLDGSGDVVLKDGIPSRELAQSILDYNLHVTTRYTSWGHLNHNH